MKRKALDTYRGPTTLGVDVSAWQPAIDWHALARSEPMLRGKRQGPVRFVVARTGDGVRTRGRSVPDPWAVRHLTGAHDAGLLVAGYHYVRAYYPPDEQVAVILEVIRTAGVRLGFVALDLEGRPDDARTTADESSGAWWSPPGAGRVDTSQVLACAEEMALDLEAQGVRVLVYTGAAWHWHVAQRGRAPTSGPLARAPLWTPYYTRAPVPRLPVGPRGEAAPWSSWQLWQYSARGIVAGVDGPDDLNRFRGDRSALDAFAGR